MGREKGALNRRKLGVCSRRRRRVSEIPGRSGPDPEANKSEGGQHGGIETDQESGNGMRKEYDFSARVRGKYAKRYAHGSNVVVLEPDVARMYRDAEAVNRALRAIAEVAPTTGRKRRG